MNCMAPLNSFSGHAFQVLAALANALKVVEECSNEDDLMVAQDHLTIIQDPARQDHEVVRAALATDQCDLLGSDMTPDRCRRILANA